MMSYFVYILKSQKYPEQFYIGYTANLENRMENHQNPKPTAYTRQYAPWELETYILFKDKRLAQEFEIYLKSHSGRAFLKKHLIKNA
jgi:putative endonuclease